MDQKYSLRRISTSEHGRKRLRNWRFFLINSFVNTPIVAGTVWTISRILLLLWLILFMWFWNRFVYLLRLVEVVKETQYATFSFLVRVVDSFWAYWVRMRGVWSTKTARVLVRLCAYTGNVCVRALCVLYGYNLPLACDCIGQLWM